MWTLIQSGRFKKDLKRYLNQPEKMRALNAVLTALSETGTVPPENRPHSLKGEWAGFLECHIQGDFLLIWKDTRTGTIILTRLGTHAELFGK